MARKRVDPKEESLREARALNPRPEAVADAGFAASEFLDARDLVQVKYEMVRRVRVDGEPVAATAQGFGFSRPSWYAAAAALDEDGLPGLLPARPGPRRAHKLTEEVLSDLREALENDPRLRTTDLVARVETRFGLRVHPRSIERALARSQHPKS
jgi:transposase